MNSKFALILGFFWVVAGQAAAQVNLLPQGNFEAPDVNTEWAEGFDIPNNQEFRVISKQGKHWLRIENRENQFAFDDVLRRIRFWRKRQLFLLSQRTK